jgi:hypothetical protein
MSQLQSVFLLALVVLNGYLLQRSKTECKKNNSFGLTHSLAVLGMFVWGDVLVLSLFWMIAALVSLLLHDWLLFLLIVSLFWLVRSIGETIYWLLQQFAVVKRDSPESLVGYQFVKNESIWFMYQVMWQCIAVVALLTSIYFTHLWLQGLSA